jgi:hypothetical protein
MEQALMNELAQRFAQGGLANSKPGRPSLFDDAVAAV